MQKFSISSRWIIAATLLLATAVIAGVYLTLTMNEYGRREVRMESRTMLSVVSMHLETDIKTINGAIVALAGSPWVRPALMVPSAINREHANSVLDRYNQAIGASVSYLIDGRGVVIASSNRKQADSFMGQFYGFRPYFTEAIKGKPHSYFAYGVTSRKKGYYTSAPVRSPAGAVLGVVVMKKDLDELENFMAQFEKCFLIDPRGIVFLSSRPEFSLKSVWPLTEKERNDLAASKQFGPGPFEPVFPRRVADGSVVTLDDEEFLVSKKDFGKEGWSLMALVPLQAMAVYRALGILTTLILFAITAGSLTFLYIREKSAYEVRLNEERFKQLAENSQDWIWEVDAEARFTYSNTSVTEITGYTVGEIIGKSFLDLIAPGERERIRRRIEKIFRDRRSVKRNRNRYLHKDGREVVLELSGLPMMDDKGNVIGFRGLSRDITEQLEILAALRDSEESFRALAENAQDAIIAMDDEGKVVYWNRAAEKILGHTRAEVLGKNLHDLIAPPRFHDAHHAALPRFRETGTGAAVGKTLELVALHSEGREFPVELSLSAVKIKDRWTAMGILRDITEHKQAEEALRRAKQEAEAASRAKSEFLAGMSHEIRTPMNAIIGMAELIMDTSLTREQQKYVTVLKNAGDHLLELINEILDLSKVEAGMLQLETMVFNLPEMMERICEEMAVRVHAKGLELISRVSPDIPPLLEGDPVRLKQVLMNLMGNAVKFTEKGSIYVDVSRLTPTEKDEETATICFRVTDTGIGIPADKQELIFEKFTQVDASVTRRYGGTGLGLAISKRLVELMGGKIELESEVGRGSTFRFTARFPIGREITGKPAEESPVDMSRLRVLIVDDNELSRLILSETVSIWGIEAVAVENGYRCLEEIKKSREAGKPFHLVLLDYQMPEMDGLEVAAAIQKMEGAAETGIIMLTSGFQKDDVDRAAQLRIFNYLYKPVKRAELREAIVAVTGGAATGGAEAPPTPDTVPAAPDTVPAAPGTAPPVEEGQGAEPPLRILLAEDNEDNRLLIRAYFKASPHRVDMAENGLEALEKFKANRYDLVLMDMQMPVMDGYTSTAAIRAWEQEQALKPVPILALTAHALKDDEKKSLAAGCDGHLTKPIKKRQLLEAVTHWTSPRKIS